MEEKEARARLRVSRGEPALVLAPMEGVTDAPMRELTGRRGGFTLCVSEFLRVSEHVPPNRVILEHMPELRTGSRTRSGLPVSLQLLGGDAANLAETASRACALGAAGIDLNFGCPAPTVNRHDGGAALLRFPDRIREIVSAVRRAVPREIPVSAKLRLGWDSMDAIHLNAERAAEGGADWLTIHGRTKVQGYLPPAYWGPIGEVRRRLGIPVIANGEIWTLDDFKRCRDQTGSEHFMLGRGALADPALPWQVARELGLPLPEGAVVAPFRAELSDWRPLIDEFIEVSRPFARDEHFILCRVKQWSRYAHSRLGTEWFDRLKRVQKLSEIRPILLGS